MTLRTVEIPAAARIDDGARKITLRIVLIEVPADFGIVDGAAVPIIATETGTPKIVGGETIVTAGSAAQTIDLVTQDSIAAASAYLVQMTAPGLVRQVYTQVPAGAGTLSWSDFIAHGTPVDPDDILSVRLLPAGAATGQYVRWNGTGWEAIDPPAGTGDVSGPASATDQAVALFDGTTGKVLADSAKTVAQLTADITATLESAGRLLPASPSEGDILIYTGGAWIATDTLPL